MISLRNLHLQRGGRPLLEDVNLTIYSGQKIGITGANGCGKSTLFALLQGELTQDTGDLDLPGGLRIAHVAQETDALELPAIDFVLQGDAERWRVECEMEQAQHADDGTRIAALHARYEALDGYTARSRAARILHGLGFEAAEHGRPVSAFSGGWRVRLNLARALLCPSDLLLLDEPTNHLDLDAVLWLEQWLRRYEGTLLLISHDRDFLDNVVGHVAHIEQRRITLYAGNYAQFERQRAERLAQQQSAYERQQREIAHMRAYVDRFRAKATKARQAQSRLKALSRMELVSAAHVDSPFRFEFPPPLKCPHPLLCLADASAGYGGVPVLTHLRLSLEPGARLGLLGRNGAGKSTLIKLLAGELAPLGGRRMEGQGLVIGYFAQHQLEQLRPERTALHHLQGADPTASEQELRNFLGGFGFSGDDALRPVAPFSGGEKARLALALIVWKRPNLLLLDEPTNHLDLDMRDALTRALQDYEGALVVVSHDRYLLRATTDRLALVGDGRLGAFDGDLDDYRDWLAQSQPAPGATDEPRPNASAADRRQQKRAAAEERNRLAQQRRPLERRLAEIERRMERLSAERDDLETLLADPALYEEPAKDRLKGALLDKARVDEALARAEEEWLEVSEGIESLG
jgi:ATP-binding cassette, subfamily F, member 3